MKVKMLVGMSSADWVLNPGDTTDVKKEVAEAWRDANIAVIVEDSPKKSNRRKKGDE